MDALKEAAGMIADAKHIVALTGAGISVESGIPDFRSPGGLWTRYPPDEYATIDAYYLNPDKVWQLWRELGAQLHEAIPNAGHAALAQLEARGKLDAIITQNIDNLHQRAGSNTVIEYHGNAAELLCLRCGRREPLQRERMGNAAPRCTCKPDALMKPAIVFFGEMIPPDAAEHAEILAENCDVMLVIGTSAGVYPCAALPFTAKSGGARIIECNLMPTDFTARITDVFLEGKAGEVLPALAQAVNALP